MRVGVLGFKVSFHIQCLHPHQSYNRLDVVVITSLFLTSQRKAINCETLTSSR